MMPAITEWCVGPALVAGPVGRALDASPLGKRLADKRRPYIRLHLFG
jgi:hypothetical protein